MNLIKTLISIIILIVITVFPFSFIAYNGTKYFYVIFTLISSFAIIYSLRKNSIFFETFLFLLIWLGFWFKFSIQISFLNNMFPEGVGKFNYLPSSFDQVMLFSSIAITALIFASFIREKFIFSYVKLEKKKKINFTILKFYNLHRKRIIYSLFTFFLFLCAINLNFSFFQKGTMPDLILPLGINNIFKWLLMFGFASFFSILIYFEFLNKKKNSNKTLKLSFLENFFSSISSISRAMIFNSTSLFYGYYRTLEFSDIKINKTKFFKYYLIISILFMISLLVVSKIRQENNFPIGHEVHDYIPKIEYENKLISENLINPINQFILEIDQIIFLIAGRWVGVDSLMAVQALDNKGFSLILQSFNEEFSFSNSFYENQIKGSYHKYPKEPKVYTIYVPGIIAYLFYSNSLLFVFISLFSLSILCSLIELIAYKIAKQNLIFASLIGNVLAYRLAHFGYMPLNSYKILIAIGINLLILYVIFKVINYFYRK